MGIRKKSSEQAGLAIGLDLDGPIIDHTENKIILARKFGFAITRLQTPSDIIKRAVPEAVGEKIQRFLYNVPPYALRPPLTRGAVTALKLLKSKGCRYYLISRRHNVPLTIRLLRERGLWPELFNENNAFFVKTKTDKNRMAAKLNIDVYLDDEPSVINKLTAVKHKFLFDPLWVYNRNRHPNSAPRMRPSGYYKIVRSWPEFIKKIKKIL